MSHLTYRSCHWKDVTMEAALNRQKPCSFCGKAEDAALSMLVVGSTGMRICDSCIESPSKEPSSLRAISCSVCAMCHYQVREPIDNPLVKVCESCISRFRRQLSAMHEKAEKAPQCSFCHKPRYSVGTLIAGDRAYICNECVSTFHASCPV
ncbi:MAG: hypothetical protein K2Z81_12785, partial [Cyanobacteria bacterium]|nr:hypothetical protein [Cyanobacteriota bacterium]